MTAIITQISEELDCSDTYSKKVLKTVFKSIADNMLFSEKITIDKFGTFSVKPLKKQVILNGNKYDIDKNTIHFSPAKKLKSVINPER